MKEMHSIQSYHPGTIRQRKNRTWERKVNTRGLEKVKKKKNGYDVTFTELRRHAISAT